MVSLDNPLVNCSETIAFIYNAYKYLLSECMYVHKIVYIVIMIVYCV